MTALAWLIAAVLAVVLGSALSRRWGHLTGVLLVSPVVLLALFEVCLAGSHALPATF